MKRIVVGITGASGSIYAKRLIEELLRLDLEIHVIATATAEKVFAYELDLEFKSYMEKLRKQYHQLILEENDNLFAGIASGSYGFDAMIVMPCSMGTLGEIAYGLSKNLLVRAADVALKEKRPLILVPRETPLNAIHLENMLKLAKMDVSILPAMPGFYHKPKSLEEAIDFVVGKVLDHLGIHHQLFQKWTDH
ncbi:flavin prenyltransferase UbiX [Cellulosilyticum sp. ST5]|uniref:UbiX family flavin prenyltransferase n=1 Tax=Cellulosilyticum sp. ST5 TaxID=3055805 RepID=UPI003977BF82